MRLITTYKYTRMYSGVEPQFVEGDVFRITIPLREVATATVGPVSTDPKRGVISGAINGAINEDLNLNENERRVLITIIQNPHITKFMLISSLNIGKGTVDRAIRSLKDKNLIERIGSNKTGYWRALNDEIYHQ